MNLHFRITNYCNIKCLNCWSLFNYNTLHMSPELVKKYILQFGPFTKEDKINICGGEPTLSPYCPEIMSIVLNTPAKITFTTNAYDVKLDLIPFILDADRIQIPIDGSDSVKCSHFRYGTLNYLDKIVQFINVLKIMNYKGVVKFGTVILDNNISDVANISKMIIGFGLHKVEWCIYPFISQNNTYYYLEDTKLLKIKEECMSNRIAFKVFIPTSRNNKYIFINPSGIATILKDNSEIVVG